MTEPSKDSDKRREWTLMFYFASDNPLAPSSISQLKALKAAGFHAEANVIARFDPFTRNTPSHVYEVNLIEKILDRVKYRGTGSNVGFDPANDPFVRNLVLDKIWEEGEDGDNVRDLITEYLTKQYHVEPADIVLPRLPKGKFHDGQSPRKSLAAFLDFCRDKYPARHYMLFILGHGVAVGNDIFLFDSDVAGPGAPDGVAAQNVKDNGGLEQDAPAARAKAGEGKDGQAGPEEGDDEPDFRNSLTLRQLGCVLRNFRTDIKKQDEGSEFELVGFHCCSMSGVEVAYELAPGADGLGGTANYMLASQGPAFVGSWPYRQMLLRILNDIDATLMPGDLADSEVLARLKSREGTAALLNKRNGKSPSLPELENAIARDFFNDEESAPAHRGQTRRKFTRAKLAEIFGEKIKARPMDNRRNVRHMLTRLFYYVLYNSFDFELAGYSFDLCLCDLTKAGKIKEPLDILAEALIEGLRGDPGLPPPPEVEARVKATGGKTEVKTTGVEPVPLARELMLLAHWDAQSFFQENYTDLYDFCFRLRRRCEHVFPALKKESSPERVAILKACKKVMELLEKGTKGEDDSERLIVRAEFAGPEYQYSRGLSIFFPWSRPTDGFLGKYRKYKLAAAAPQPKQKPGAQPDGGEARQEGGREPERKTWADFLEVYFTNTERETSVREEELIRAYTGMDKGEGPDGSVRDEDDGGGNIAEVVLDLVNVISKKMFSPAEQLAADSAERLDGGGLKPGKVGDTDLTGPGKVGDTDISGDGCGCGSIKNYPHFTGMSQGASKNFRPTSQFGPSKKS